ncbi:OsmC family protein [Algiphilus sp. W345]|uniref:OsmC family protein n=1 Tax=Banduia mediterranea TaxID=3075609 RepID=A0ABU2WFT1_9GAMM|nr:OsmC family protein [Algiphilus sp. W345]MDT0496729.1 OsmC family protein [Algiphilus sp. W345]
MALSMMLEQAGMAPEYVHTQATVTLDKDGDGFAVTGSHLDVLAKIPGGDPQKFEDVAAQAKAGCLVLKLLSCKITMAAELET